MILQLTENSTCSTVQKNLLQPESEKPHKSHGYSSEKCRHFGAQKKDEAICFIWLQVKCCQLNRDNGASWTRAA